LIKESVISITEGKMILQRIVQWLTVHGNRLKVQCIVEHFFFVATGKGEKEKGEKEKRRKGEGAKGRRGEGAKG
jgi:hypothetical protein